MSDPLPPRKRVAIVGAGASGLTAARQALSYGVEPVVFEASHSIGGLWHYKPEETEESSVMKSTVINTSKEMTAFSDFPPPAHFANFMHNRRMLEYLELYADHFHLKEHIRFGNKVLGVERHKDTYEAKGTWVVSYTNGPSNEVHCEVFDGVLLCTGHHTRPHWPEGKWPGQDSFQGRISHAHSYKDHRGFEDQCVVVVGVGNSGVDIAVELSRVARQVYLVTRRGTWVLHRNLDHSIPFDLLLNNRLLTLIQGVVPTWLASLYLQRMVEQRMDHERFGLKPAHGVLAAHWTVNDELPNRLSCGTILVRPNIQDFTGPRSIRFEDGSSVEGVDQLILSTGYFFEFPLVEGGKLIPVHDNSVQLYLNMFPLVEGCGEHNTLAVIGLIQPLGSIMPIAEMQARLYFDALTGECKLPSRVEMLRHAHHQMAQMDARYVRSRRHTIQVDYVSYMDELASLMGCRPQPLRHLMVGDPRLAKALLLGPNAPYVYRLRGPKKWDGAREAVLSLWGRVEKGMRGSEELKPTAAEKLAEKEEMQSLMGGGTGGGNKGGGGGRGAMCCGLKGLLIVLLVVLTLWAFEMAVKW